ncbi:oligogalacturonate-specific porin KdgM family protein [Pectobacteriaceae bacterium CE90]|nr:oligogalacturonate-specific porin KdgM family protein [Prodigiosinella sp. LS101]WJV55743.1 oligogalacturonate-specific porin KdgM family protein [Prodigiosinella sp. LS101]WJV60105.1 oligogalacturonate-specific porin KdgM family protein [Pectobacteriaceae bacterium C111]WJY13192.1 oligogalacturonate-specific porin KdgM family protein [Pectobacteriaceae bacterium CE90]
MKLKLLALAVTSLISINALAVSIDYRHEWRDTAKGDQRDRLLISNRFANGFGLSSEVSWKQSSADSTPNKPFNEQVSNETEVIASYLYKFNQTFSLESGFSLVSGSTYRTYRPYLRGGVKFADDWTATLRYRPYYKRISGNIGSSSNTAENGYNITANVGYTFLKDYNISYEYDFKKINHAGAKSYDNHSYNADHQVKLSYKWDKNWKPYISLSNLADNGTSDHRQTRYRVGVVYTF